MATFENFTIDEITKILSELDVSVYQTSAIDNENEMEILECEIGDISFLGFLLPQEPFFEELTLKAGTWVAGNPFEFVNNFNSEKRASTAFVELDDDGLSDRDEEGRSFVIARLPISFVGGVTKDHVEFLLRIWIEDLIDFFQIEFESDDFEEEIIVVVPDDLSNSGTPLIERLNAFLEVSPNKTAREIARALKVDKQKINRVLYRNLKTFQKTSDQPPIWSMMK